MSISCSDLRLIEMVPIDQISVVNPRSRGKNKFNQIVNNISGLGLKKPVTVARRGSRSGVPAYDLVCGQGRLEAYRALGQTEVPAFVIEASRDELLLMGLAENLARRVHTSAELMRELGALKDRGHSYSAIARKTGLHIQYVKDVMRLLNKGEERLLRAVERGQIPVTIAVTIAGADDVEVQKALREAYEERTLRGKELLRARRLIEERRTSGKRLTGRARRTNAAERQELVRAYKDELSRQRLLIKKARAAETRLLFVVSALRQLLRDEAFVNLLRAEALDEMPQNLADRMARQGAAP